MMAPQLLKEKKSIKMFTPSDFIICLARVTTIRFIDISDRVEGNETDQMSVCASAD